MEGLTVSEGFVSFFIGVLEVIGFFCKGFRGRLKDDGWLQVGSRTLGGVEQL